MLYQLTVNGYGVAYILWNLLLLIIPFFICAGLILYTQKTKLKTFKHKSIALLLAAFWLLFIPNTAYVIADVRHISGFCGLSDEAYRNCTQNSWMILFFYIYASIGWVAMVLLINQMKDYIKSLWGKQAARWFQFVIIPVITVGVLLGLINRWNSWDVFIFPTAIFSDAWRYLSQEPFIKNFIIFSIWFYILYFAGDLIFTKKKINIKINYKK